MAHIRSTETSGRAGGINDNKSMGVEMEAYLIMSEESKLEKKRKKSKG